MRVHDRLERHGRCLRKARIAKEAGIVDQYVDPDHALTKVEPDDAKLLAGAMAWDEMASNRIVADKGWPPA